MLNESTIRVGSFVIILAIMGIAESIWPRRILATGKVRRWLSNLSVAIISTSLVRLALPLAPTTFALYCNTQGWGLFNSLELPQWLVFIVSILLFDLIIYWQHVIFHKNQILWRIHRMHHADLDIDTSTGIRFHPIEIGLSMLIKLSAILAFGPSATAVLTFEILLNGCALFNHANLRLPIGLDALLRLFVVTPDQHRVHHSTDMREANMNFGFNFPWWDRMFGTYKAQPASGHTDMKIGLNILRDPKFTKLSRMLTIPFI